MALKQKSSKSSNAGKTGGYSDQQDRPKAIWRTALTVKSGKEKNYCSADNYGGCLVWREYADGKEPGDNDDYFQVLTANIFDRKDNEPDFVLNKIVLNLANPKSATKLGEE